MKANEIALAGSGSYRLVVASGFATSVLHWEVPFAALWGATNTLVDEIAGHRNFWKLFTVFY